MDVPTAQLAGPVDNRRFSKKGVNQTDKKLFVISDTGI